MYLGENHSTTKPDYLYIRHSPTLMFVRENQLCVKTVLHKTFWSTFLLQPYHYNNITNIRKLAPRNENVIKNYE